MNQNTKLAIVLGLGILVIVGIGISGWSAIDTVPYSPAALEPLPAANELPSNESFWTDHSNLSVSADVFYFPFRAHSGDFFELALTLSVNNYGPNDILNFKATKISVFRDDHVHFYTFGLLPSGGVTIGGLTNRTLTYSEDRDIETLNGLLDGWSGLLYSRIELTFDGEPSFIVNSPTTLVYMTIE
jgi:hypothetical protein